MKRIRAACICQTLHFFQKDNVEHEYAAQAVQNEVKNYKKTAGEKSCPVSDPL